MNGNVYKNYDNAWTSDKTENLYHFYIFEKIINLLNQFVAAKIIYHQKQWVDFQFRSIMKLMEQNWMYWKSLRIV